MSQTNKRALVFINAGAWQVQEHEQEMANLREQLAQVQITADLRRITDVASIQQIISATPREAYDLIVAAGGDGTVQQVATCLFDTPTPLGILPLGTMNNVAVSLGIPADLPAACAMLAHEEPRQIDMGLVNGQPFIEVVTIGPESDLAALAERTRHQGLHGMWQATIEGIAQVRHLRRHAVTLSYDGHRKHWHVWAITVCNTPVYGLRYAPVMRARLDDGRLDLVITRHRSLGGYLRYWWRVLWGRREADPRVHIIPIRSLQVSSRTPMGIAISGYVIGKTPAKIRIVPCALTVIAPPLNSMPLDTGSPIASIMQSISAPATPVAPHDA